MHHPEIALTAVVVCICTFNRPDALTRLLRALSTAATGSLANQRIDVLVVDDSKDGNARPVVEREASQFPGEMHYSHLGAGNVALARNRAIEEGSKIAPWMAWIDDDCVPDPQWLAALFDVQLRTGADVVTGHVVYTTPPGAPAWLHEQPFCDFTMYTDGEEPTFGTTANALVRTACLEDNGVRFHADLGPTGGEDMTFFHELRDAGGRLRYSAKAIVYEELSDNRQTLRYQAYRQLWLGNNMAEINRYTGEWPSRRLFLRGAKWAVRSWTDALARLSRREPPQLRWALALSLRGVGLMVGVAGVRFRHRP
jgi:glycosyltransferase involved in cell wall biosynthesis